MKSLDVKEKIVITILCIWSFLHTYLLIKIFGYSYTTPEGYKIVRIDGNAFLPAHSFYPFTYNETQHISNFEIGFYDYSEYFVYVGGAWMIFLLYRYFKGSKLTLNTKL